MSELRWNPILREWVITATHRQDRTFLPPAEYCPLCPTKSGSFPSEVPAEEYDIVVFDNKFPSLQASPPEPSLPSSDLYEVRPAVGACEVILYTSNHHYELADLPVRQVEKLVQVWADRFQELGDRPEVDYVFIFENKGREIGVTLTHPHGQIYAYPTIPPIIERELAGSKQHFDKHGECLFCRILRDELADGRRIVATNEHFAAIVPFFARYPYEIHVLSRRHAECVTDLMDDERRSLAEILKVVTQTYARLWDRSIPYIMVTHQRPTDGQAYPHYHYHVEFYPPNRTADKLKYLAGSEAGAGAYINDTHAEETAATLRSIASSL